MVNSFSIELALERNMPVVDSDFDLIRQVAAGRESALRQVYDTYGQRMYALALRVTGDPAAAEEAVQESLISVWQGAARFRGESQAIAWLLGIVHHKALDQLRGRVFESLDEGMPGLPDERPQPFDHAEAGEHSRLIRAGMEQLSPEHRAVLDLVFYQGLSLNEAAEVCGCPVGTVKSRLNYAKASLRGVLSRAGLAAEDLEG